MRYKLYDFEFVQRNICRNGIATDFRVNGLSLQQFFKRWTQHVAINVTGFVTPPPPPLFSPPPKSDFIIYLKSEVYAM